MLALVIALFFIAAVFGHLIKARRGARMDREFYEELVAARQRTSERDAIVEAPKNPQRAVSLSGELPTTGAPW